MLRFLAHRTPAATSHFSCWKRGNTAVPPISAACTGSQPWPASSSPKPRRRQSRAVSTAAAAAAKGKGQQEPPAPSPELQAKVAQLLQQSESLQAQEKWGEAVVLLRQGLKDLEAEGPAAAMPSLLLHQIISDLLYSAGEYQAAAEEAGGVYSAICGVAGEGTPQATLFGLKLGIYEAAAGEREVGTQRIFEAGAQAGKGLEQALAVGEHMEADGAEAADLAEQEAYVAKLVGSLGESAFYYTTFSIANLGAAEDWESLEENWGMLEAAMVRGMGDIVRSEGANSLPVKNALREHYRVVEEVAGRDSSFGDRLQKQRAKLLMLAGKL